MVEAVVFAHFVVGAEVFAQFVVGAVVFTQFVVGAVGTARGRSRRLCSSW